MVEFSSTQKGFTMTAKEDMNSKSTETQPQSPAVDVPNENDALTQLEKLQTDVSQLTDMLKRKQAEFENYQKRMEAQSNQLVAFSAQRILTKVIPVIDMFELALKHKENAVEFANGLEMIHSSFERLLADENVQTPSLVGEKFDSKFALAVGTKVVAGKPAGIVLEQMSNCYVLNDRVIKYANVIVSAAPSSGDAASHK